jgi:uncharacterized membrane protein YcaP (DUF421 family)
MERKKITRKLTINEKDRLKKKKTSVRIEGETKYAKLKKAKKESNYNRANLTTNNEEKTAYL